MLEWAKFWALAMIWGSSFLLIKVAVEDMGALPLVSVRLGGAGLLFLGYLLWTGRRIPARKSERYALLFVGIFNTAVPFFLISWGETKIDSGLATVLNSTVPLFGLVFAHFLLADERLTPQKITGLIVGFIGVVIMTARSIGGDSGSFMGQLAVLVASASYAIAIVTVRMFLRQVESFTVAGLSAIVGGIAIISTTAVVEGGFPANISTVAWLAAITLAVVNTFVAYFLAFDLIEKWGVRASLVTYAMPPIGVTLGFLFLDEVIGFQLIIGAVLIIGGIVMARQQGRPPVPQAEIAIETGD
jgi:drug/metabolite transporter (DMT)-like permease